MKVADSCRTVGASEALDLAREIIRRNIELSVGSSCVSPDLKSALADICDITSGDEDRQTLCNNVLVRGSRCLATYDGPVTLEFLELLHRMVEAASWIDPGVVREYSGMVYDAGVRLAKSAELSGQQKELLDKILYQASAELVGTDVNAFVNYRASEVG